MSNQWPLGDKELKIGILGMTEGNGHPYSWGAMFNGYNKEAMDLCPFPVIPQYLYKQPEHTFGMPGVKLTHICCTGWAERDEAERIAAAANIPNVVDDPTEMIGQVDAVICATDDGNEHVERCKPFLDAGIPMFIDKPLVNTAEDLKTFIKWREEGKHFISSSSMRYCKEFEPFYKCHYELGELMYICSPMAKKYEHYGIHALEAMYPLLGEGFEWIQSTGEKNKDLMTIQHKNGCRVTIVQGVGMCGAGMMLLGSKDSRILTAGDSYYAFKKQLDLFVNWLRTGEEPVAFSDTVELMKLVIGGLQSRDNGNVKVYLKDII